jgi:Response regulators consisting of a CheY-like receiver domain and a winged-helix DNA-binding domain
MCILIIEDEAKIASYLVKGLNESGYEAQCVHSGLEGLEKLKMHAYSLVILDVMLPDIDGWAVLKVLRQFSQIPVIFLTAKDQVIDRVKGLELGPMIIWPSLFLILNYWPELKVYLGASSMHRKTN